MSARKLAVRLADLPGCFEGSIPAAICTVAEDATPNVTYLSVVHRIDDGHVALSRQFFNKTEHNTVVNPHAEVAYHQLAGVLCLQSEVPGAFQSTDECVAGILANQAAMAMATPGKAPRDGDAAAVLRPVQVKHYREDDSLFLDNEYLIKGVAGGILWRLLRNYQEQGRVEFSNREIRLDQTLALPDIKDNLEARLILLRKRLEERCDYLRIVKTSRGRFTLHVTRPLTLVQVEGGGPL